MELDTVLLAALRARSVRERLRLRMSGGFTAVQLFHRLGDAEQRALLGGEDNTEVAVRGALERLQAALGGLEGAGRVLRRRVKLQTQDGRGPRSVQVDVYRLS